MSIQFIHKKAAGTESSPTSIGDNATGKAIIRNLVRAAGLAYDRSANFLKYNGNDAIRTVVDAESAQSITGVKTMTSPVLTTPTLTNPKISGRTPIDVTGPSVTLGTTHVGRVVTLSRAAGIAVTLPAATGSGDVYELIVAVSFTGAASIAVASGTDYMIGVAQMGIDGGTFVPHQYPTANSGVVATESDTISLFGTANSQGGFKGAKVYLQDIAAAVWDVLYISDAGGTEATPFSAAV